MFQRTIGRILLFEGSTIRIVAFSFGAGIGCRCSTLVEKSGLNTINLILHISLRSMLILNKFSDGFFAFELELELVTETSFFPITNFYLSIFYETYAYIVLNSTIKCRMPNPDL